MSRNTATVLMYHCHKHINLISYFRSTVNFYSVCNLHACRCIVPTTGCVLLVTLCDIGFTMGMCTNARAHTHIHFLPFPQQLCLIHFSVILGNSCYSTFHAQDFIMNILL
jgi:hypothetical protein